MNSVIDDLYLEQHGPCALKLHTLYARCTRSDKVIHLFSISPTMHGRTADFGEVNEEFLFSLAKFCLFLMCLTAQNPRVTMKSGFEIWTMLLLRLIEDFNFICEYNSWTRLRSHLLFAPMRIRPLKFSHNAVVIVMATPELIEFQSAFE